MGLQDIESDLYGDVENDAELEAELAALQAEGNPTPRAQHQGELCSAISNVDYDNSNN